MNRTPEEKLFDYLENVDEDFLVEAMDIDSAEKLEKSKKVPLWIHRPAFRWTAVVAACLAILLCILPLLQSFAPVGGGEQPNTPPMLYDPTWPSQPSTPTAPTQPNESLDPPWEVVGTNISIESADMLHYYSAIYLLSQQYQANLTASGSSSGNGLTLLDEPDIGDEPYCTMPSSPWELETEPPGNTEPPMNTEGPAVEPSTEYTAPVDNENYYYYEIDPKATFHISKVVFFRIQLSGDGFLAQTLGTGIVDVVITDFEIWGDLMITFKNGDKYLSCLTNGHSAYEFEFSTHKYIEGFYVVKDGRHINYRFVVTLDHNIQVDHFECDYWDYFNPGNPDGIIPLVGETYIADTDISFTIGDLESHFRNIQIPNQTEQ